MFDQFVRRPEDPPVAEITTPLREVMPGVRTLTSSWRPQREGGNLDRLFNYLQKNPGTHTMAELLDFIFPDKNVTRKVYIKINNYINVIRRHGYEVLIEKAIGWKKDGSSKRLHHAKDEIDRRKNHHPRAEFKNPKVISLFDSVRYLLQCHSKEEIKKIIETLTLLTR